ncbi:hypothetical protein E2C01_067318 [Portunus trituberculatus]|uniref:Uncharacterized protein n=1 Tax=Portunus trituberculatus TaxID=210409 RepID=A0A5B7HNT0_PORTR|nr:hypothetical protein [Portunus trituberculatus]
MTSPPLPNFVSARHTISGFSFFMYSLNSCLLDKTPSMFVYIIFSLLPLSFLVKLVPLFSLPSRLYTISLLSPRILQKNAFFSSSDLSLCVCELLLLLLLLTNNMTSYISEVKSAGWRSCEGKARNQETCMLRECPKTHLPGNLGLNTFSFLFTNTTCLLLCFWS